MGFWWRRGIGIAGVWLLGILAGGVAAEAGESPGVLVILDASGSMAEVRQGVAKIDAARRVLHDVIPTLPPEIAVGFAAYGHRRKGDCDDVELLVPLGASGREEILKQADALRPKGKTPLAAAVRQMAEALGAREDETTILLVSDGQDTCTPDPCALVRGLKDRGLRFVLHVVGFDVASADGAQLRCMAEAGGGTYFGAADGAQLREAFQTVQRRVEAQAKITPAQARTVTAVSRLAKLRLVFPGESAKSLAFVRIEHPEGKILKTVERPEGESTHPLPAGTYRLVLGFSNPNYRDPTEVGWDLPVTVQGDTAVTFGALAFNMAPPLEEAVEAVEIAGQENAFSLVSEAQGNGYYLFTPKPLPPGRYDVRFRFARQEGWGTMAQGVTVTPGAVAPLTFDAGLVVTKPREGAVRGWDLVSSETGAPVLSVRRRSDNDEPLWRHFPVPPGRYDLHLFLEGMEEPLKVGEGVAIESGHILAFDPGM